MTRQKRYKFLCNLSSKKKDERKGSDEQQHWTMIIEKMKWQLISHKTWTQEWAKWLRSGQDFFLNRNGKFVLISREWVQQVHTKAERIAIIWFHCQSRTIFQKSRKNIFKLWLGTKYTFFVWSSFLGLLLFHNISHWKACSTYFYNPFISTNWGDFLF